VKKPQNGFSAVEALLIVIIVGMLGGVGWYVWHSQKQVDKTYSQTANSSAVPKSTKSAQPISSPQASTNNFLVISEWGVKVSYNSSIGKAVYRTDSLDPGIAFLSTDTLANTDCDVNHNGGGYFIRFKDGQMDGEAKKTYTDEYPNATKLGSYYYAYGLPETAATCSSNTSVQQKATQAADEFKNSIKSAQLAS
jgi:hypothetical protein